MVSDFEKEIDLGRLSLEPSHVAFALLRQVPLGLYSKRLRRTEMAFRRQKGSTACHPGATPEL